VHDPSAKADIAGSFAANSFAGPGRISAPLDAAGNSSKSRHDILIHAETIASLRFHAPVPES
jgi:hypothetical protein